MLFQLFGRAGKVIFYCIDWVPQRFDNVWLNRLYRLLDRLAVTHADQTWNLSDRMAEVRVERGITAGAKQVTVPVGIWLQRYPDWVRGRWNEAAVMYMGHVRAGQGLSLVMRAWPQVVEHHPTASLHIIGDGKLRESLQSQAAAAGVAESVTWHGFVPDHRQVEQQLVAGRLAVAMYEPGTFTQYTDPGKLKVYLAAGLPIVMTRVGQIADIIEQAGAGLVIPYERQAFVEAIDVLLSDARRQEAMREAARRLAIKYDWEFIFPTALEEILQK